jgi:hypothetical protein
MKTAEKSQPIRATLQAGGGLGGERGSHGSGGRQVKRMNHPLVHLILSCV